MGFNIKNNYGPNIEVNDGGKVVVVQGKDGLWHAAEPEETDFEEVTVEPAPDANKPTEKQKATPVEQETFADRVKAIMRKAATKNGQRIETSARGNAGAYIFWGFLPCDGRDGEQLWRRPEGDAWRYYELCAGDQGVLIHRQCGKDARHQRSGSADGRHAVCLRGLLRQHADGTGQAGRQEDQQRARRDFGHVRGAFTQV